MSEDELYLVTARDLGEQYLRCIYDASMALDADDARMCIGDASAVAQNMLDALEDAVNTVDLDFAEQIEEAIHVLGISMDVADQAIELNDEDIPDLVLEMQRYAEHSVEMLSPIAA